MNKVKTTGQLLSSESSGHERILNDRYFENIFYELGAYLRLGKEMFQAFPLAIIRFGDTTLIGRGLNDPS